MKKKKERNKAIYIKEGGGARMKSEKERKKENE
jgi:hypothetical protein